MPGLTEQPVIDGGGRSGQFEPALELRLLSGSQLFRNLQEFRRALRHRYVLANFAGLTIPGIVLLYALDSARMPIDLQVPAVVVGLLIAQMLLLSYLTCAVWLVQLIRKDARIIRIWVTPGLTLGAAGMLAAVHVMHQSLDVQQDWTEARSSLIPVFCVLYLELAAHFVFRGPMPRALAQLRGGVDPLAGIAEGRTDLARLAAETASGASGQEAPVQNGDLLIRLGIAPADILRLEASGNYVAVVTRAGRHLVPGPFSTVVAQMPAGLGRQVQRSHWVALAGVEGLRKQGRELWLQMACGALVPVSAAMKAEVQAWLDAGGRANRPALRDGTGRRAGGKVA